jgi:hypothetical protein
MTTAMHGMIPLYKRRLRVTTKTLSGTIGQTVLPVSWILVIAPALDKALGGFNPNVDYYTFLAVAQVTFIVPFTAMFNGLNVIVDRQFGITRELLVAPISRNVIPFANAAGVTTVALLQSALILGLGVVRGATFTTRWTSGFFVIPCVIILTVGIYGIAETLALRINRQGGIWAVDRCSGRCTMVYLGNTLPAHRTYDSNAVRVTIPAVDACGRDTALRIDEREGFGVEQHLGIRQHHSASPYESRVFGDTRNRDNEFCCTNFSTSYPAIGCRM